MEIATLPGADFFVPLFPRPATTTAATVSAAPAVPANPAAPAPTLDQLRRRPRPPLAWELTQCARNFSRLRHPQAANVAPRACAASLPEGWTARGL